MRFSTTYDKNLMHENTTQKRVVITILLLLLLSIIIIKTKDAAGTIIIINTHMRNNSSDRHVVCHLHKCSGRDEMLLHTHMITKLLIITIIEAEVEVHELIDRGAEAAWLKCMTIFTKSNSKRMQINYLMKGKRQEQLDIKLRKIDISLHRINNSNNRSMKSSTSTMSIPLHQSVMHSLTLVDLHQTLIVLLIVIAVRTSVTIK